MRQYSNLYYSVAFSRRCFAALPPQRAIFSSLQENNNIQIIMDKKDKTDP